MPVVTARVRHAGHRRRVRARRCARLIGSASMSARSAIRGPVLGAEVAGQARSAGQHLRVETRVGQLRRRRTAWWRTPGDPARGWRGCAGARRPGRRSGRPASDSAPSARLMPGSSARRSSSTRSRSAGVSASRTTVRASMIAPRRPPCRRWDRRPPRRERRLVHRRAARVDPDDRVDAGHHLGDVAHVGAAQRQRSLDFGRHGVRPSRSISARNTSASQASGVSSGYDGSVSVTS